MKHFETIIVGGGVAGLACARRLTDAGKTDFQVVTKDLIGSIPESRNKAVNFGAYYIQDNYHNFLPYAERRKRIHFKDMRFYEGDESYSLLQLRHAPHTRSLVRFLLFLRKVHKHHELFKKRCETRSQWEALSEDPFLLELHRKPAPQLISELHLEYWDTHLLKYLSWVIGFMDTKDLTAFDLCVGALILVIPVYEFDYVREKLTDGFDDEISLETVDEIWKEGDVWRVETDKGSSFTCSFLVMATPAHVTRNLLSVTDEMNTPRHAYAWQVQGIPREHYQSDTYMMLPVDSRDLSITKQEDGTYLVYSLNQKIDLHKYFSSASVLDEVKWEPAFFFGNKFIKEDRGDNSFVIGGHNIGFIENTFITGLYAANKIIERS